ncbi:[protein-PII] uridylyltransferase [Corynebacterium sp. HS2168-gen11]|uniref:[protein-PII] uridylyltransferase n=1 Tax=Corynebacterium sp. HS2168-gen11 TaxID=2974027 RepID=UPI00216AB667|nr:[protein-PII] uridylyltransferase [Corynebacterium sp. HS2168-gen11]MCS4536269.1 [protein-PII] uridylyltransferase [Corynebacterium sp. HS2168-gen11]
MAPTQFSAQDIRAAALKRVSQIINCLELPPGTALAAVGSLSRGELQPRSDLDLILLHDGSLDPEAAASLWYPIWDAKLRLDYAVRTAEECATIVQQDPIAALSLLELHHLAGNAELSQLARQRILKQWRAVLIGNFNQLVDLAIARWRRSGSVVAMTHPDIKHGRGGLRDHEFLKALALGNLVDLPDLSTQRKLLCDVRTMLHEHAGRARDVLDPEFAFDVAEDLGFSDRYALASAIAAAARDIDEALTHALDQARHLLPRPVHRRYRIRRPLDVDVVAVDDAITLSRTPDLTDPGLPLRVAAVSARTGLPIHPHVWKRLAKVPPMPPGRWKKTAASDFFTVLSSAKHTARVILEFDEHGLWAPLVPEWEHIRQLMPREPTHIRTVDRHILATVELCAASSVTVARPDLLLLAALFHDIGKGYNHSHSLVGAAMVADMANKLGLSAQDKKVVVALVKYHTFIPKLVATKDIESASVVAEILDALGYNLLAITLMEVLVEADARATGPGVWSPKLQAGLNYLCQRARAQLTTTPPSPPVVRYGGEIAVYENLGSTAVVYWSGSYIRESVRPLALIAAKNWNIISAAFVNDSDGVSAEMQVYNMLGTGFDEREFIQAYKSGVYSALPTIEPGAVATFWHDNILEVRTTDRKAALGTLIGVLPEWEWINMHTPGATMIVQVSMVGNVDRCKIERDITKALATG